MKTLSLYIDRWYIAASVCCDNIPHRIQLPNKEEKIWLYFYEDINNDRVNYGKSYKKHYLDKEVHYHGDVFSKIVNETYTFKRFGKDINFKEIFKASEILEHLKSDFDKNIEIETYISFSIDVSYAAQKVFIEILESNGFKIKESTARISHLAAELSYRRGLLKDAKYILFVVACNENLRYVIYKYSNKVFLRQSNEGVLYGHGTDLRGRALLEQIVWQINNSSKFLNKDEEEDEIIRLSQYLEPWLLQLDNTKNGRPIRYNDITFSRAPYNKQTATIIKNTIEERTKTIVNDVVDQIVQYVKEKDISFSDISHIVFIGDSFKNSMFKDSLLLQYALKESNIISYSDSDLPEIVGVYGQIDLSQFDSLRKNIEHLSSEELEQIKIAEEERKEREKASLKQKEIDDKNAAIREDDKKFTAIMYEVDNYEKKGDYSNMLDMLKVAETLKPNDSEVKSRIDEVNIKLSEIRVKNEQYNKKIKAAQDAFNAHRWQEAYLKSESALELRPDAEEAKRINSDSYKKIQLAETLKEFILRADTFIGQKLYEEALEELNKAKHVDAKNKEIIERINKIGTIQQEFKTKIDDLEKRYLANVKEENFDKAIEICNTLIEIDTSNSQKWRDYISKINAELERKKKNTELLEKLKRDINEANFNEQWHTLVSLCKEGLSLQQDDLILKYLKKAEARLQIIDEQKAFDQAVSDIKSLIADKSWNQANLNTKELQKKYPEHNDIAKQLFRLIFEAEDTWNSKSEIKDIQPKRTPIGFDTKETSKDFFAEDTSKKRPTSKPQNIEIDKKRINSSQDDDFLNTDFKSSSKNNTKNTPKGLTNKDFNF